MKNKKKLIILALQIIISIIFVMGYKTYVDFSLQPVTVIGFASDLEAGTKITQRDLLSIPVSQMTLNGNMITLDNINSIVGKYTKMDVIANSIAYSGQLSDTAGVDKFASLDLSNARVISIPATYMSSAQGEFERGDTIDLIYSASATAEGGGDQSFNFTYSKIFMQGVTVYQVNTESGYRFTPHTHMYASDVITLPDGTQTTTAYSEIASVSIIVTPEQAEEIYTRKQNGTIEIIKRFDESETHETLGFVIGNYGKIFVGNASTETGNVNISDSFVIGNTEGFDEDLTSGANMSATASGVE